MLMDVDYEVFHKLLKTAIGGRTQRQFAEECGITPTYLNRLLHTDTITPTPETLTKIAEHSEVLMGDLMRACGYPVQSAFEQYEIELASPRPLPLTPFTAEISIDVVQNVLQPEIIDRGHIEINDVVDLMNSRLSELSGKFSSIQCELAGDPKTVTTDEIPGGEHQLQVLEFRWQTMMEACIHKRVVIWNEHDLQFRNEPAFLGKYFPEAVDPSRKVSDKSYYENTLRPASGNLTEDERREKMIHRMRLSIQTVELGIGFYANKISDETMVRFCKKYEDDLPYMNDYHDFPNPDYPKGKKSRKPEKGIEYAASEIMTIESGIPICYMEPDGKRLNRAVFMVTESDARYYDQNMILAAMRRFSSELGVEKYGTVWHVLNRLFPAEPQFSNLQKEPAEAAKDSAAKEGPEENKD